MCDKIKKHPCLNYGCKFAIVKEGYISKCYIPDEKGHILMDSVICEYDPRPIDVSDRKGICHSFTRKKE